MKRLTPVFLILAFASSLHAQPVQPKDVPPPIKVTPLIPAKAQVGTGYPLVLDAGTAKGKVKWQWDGDPKCVVVRDKTLAFASAIAGVYKVSVLYVNDAGDIAGDTCEITVGVSPDKPPEDTVTLQSLSKQITLLTAIVKQNTVDIAALQKQPPPVVDAFQAAVQAAWVADGKDVASAASLAALYRNSGPTVANSAKASDVLTTMHTAAISLIGDKMPTVRRVLADEFNAVMGKTDKTLDAPTRALIAAEFKKAQTALEGVK